MFVLVCFGFLSICSSGLIIKSRMKPEILPYVLDTVEMQKYFLFYKSVTWLHMQPNCYDLALQHGIFLSFIKMISPCFKERA